MKTKHLPPFLCKHKQRDRKKRLLITAPICFLVEIVSTEIWPPIQDDGRLMVPCNFRTFPTPASVALTLGFLATRLNTEGTLFIFRSLYGLIIEVLCSLVNRSLDMHFLHVLRRCTTMYHSMMISREWSDEDKQREDLFNFIS